MSTDPQATWRVGGHHGLHVYERGTEATASMFDRPVATFHRPGDAQLAVRAVNARLEGADAREQLSRREQAEREARQAREDARATARKFTDATEAHQVLQLQLRGALAECESARRDAQGQARRAERAEARAARAEREAGEARTGAENLQQHWEELRRECDAVVDQSQALVRAVELNTWGTSGNGALAQVVAALREVIKRGDYLPGGRLAQAQARVDQLERYLQGMGCELPTVAEVRA